jgi:hypothetical protein
MDSKLIKAVIAGAALAGATAAGNPAVKRAFDLPPSADLSYSIKARQKGIALAGEALTSWRAGDGKYSVSSDTRASILGKILENRSEGLIDDHGIAPLTFTEKRFRKAPYTVTFERDSKTIRFTEGKETYPLKGGEQDRGSAPWQLAAVARAAPEKFVPGSEWRFFVAGRRDAEPWVFKVVKQEKVRTGLGDLDTVHLVKAPSADARDQQLDIWLAPGHEWYPVRLRFSDRDDSEVVEQTLEKLVKK